MSRFLQYINFSGLIVHQTDKGKKVKLSITDRDTIAKLNNILGAKKYGDHRKPMDNDTFQIVLSSRTKITSEDGREDVTCLRSAIGWRCHGKLLIKPYCFTSTWSDSKEEIKGVLLNATQIHLGV